MFAKVVFSMGRCHLKVGGFCLATEGDKCRDGNLPEEVLPPIPQEELDRATIGGKPASDLPIEMIRWFRGDNWDERMMRHVADEINKQVPCPAASDPAPPEPTGATLENLLVGTQVLTKSGEKAWVHRITGQQIFLSFEGYPYSGRRFPSQTPYGIEDLVLPKGATP